MREPWQWLTWTMVILACAGSNALGGELEANSKPSTLQAGTSDDANRKITDGLYDSALQSIAEGRKSDASETLMRVIEHEPLHAGAWLDLALLQCGLGQAEEAERLFAAVERRFTLSMPMKKIIADERASGCRHWQAAGFGSLAMGRGFDQNVNQGARTSRYLVDAPGGQVEYELSDDFRPRHDQYLQLSGEYLREVTPNGSLGFIQFQFRRNDALHQYNSASTFIGVESPLRFGNWRMRGTGTFGLVTLGSHLYQRQAQLQVRVTPPLPLPQGFQFDTVAALTHNQLQTLSNFDSSTRELRAHLSWRNAQWYVSASAGLQADHALEQRPGGSRDGSHVTMLIRRSIGLAVNTELAYSRQAWRSSSVYSPGLIDQVRDQQTHVLRATLTYPLRKYHALLIEGRLVHNSENISIFQYNNRQLQLSWQWQLP